MIQHIVMFKLKAEAEGHSAAENLQTAVERLADLEAQVPSLKKLTVLTGTDGVPQSNYDLALVCLFDDLAGLDAYQTHPAHLAFGAFIAKVREARACIDAEI